MYANPKFNLELACNRGTFHPVIHRNLAAELERAATWAPSVTLTGPRQSGKTTLCRAVFAGHPYRSLEAPDERAFAQEDPRAFLAQFPRGAVLDEVQRVPDLLSYLQGVIDADPVPGRWVLSGSRNFALLESVTQSLAGRTAVHRLLPLSWDEIGRFPRRPASLDEALFSGGYPHIFDRGLHPPDWLRSYVATYVERDVRTIGGVGDLTTFQRFVELCAGRTGQLLNYSSLADDRGQGRRHALREPAGRGETRTAVFAGCRPARRRGRGLRRRGTSTAHRRPAHAVAPRALRRAAGKRSARAGVRRRPSRGRRRRDGAVSGRREAPGTNGRTGTRDARPAPRPPAGPRVGPQGRIRRMRRARVDPGRTRAPRPAGAPGRGARCRLAGRSTYSEGTLTDIVDSRRRSAMMSRIKGRDTVPEVVVRRIVHRLGFRFRLHRKDLPGRPDLVFPRYRSVVFVHGCFWHRHEGCRFAYEPKTRTGFWSEKFHRNVARDRDNEKALRALGWRVLVIWECEMRNLTALEERLLAHLRGSGDEARRSVT